MTTPLADSRILIVEDAPANIQALTAILRDGGYRISVATTGLQALEVLAKVRPDLILLDVVMPDIDGFETCTRIKASPDWRDIPIIFLTSKTGTADIVRGFELGAVDYVGKPFHAHELLARVATHLAMDRLRRENERLIRDQSESARHRSVAQMVAGVAHEINTPLGIVRTAADLITQAIASPTIAALAQTPDGKPVVEDLAEAARLIERNAARAHTLVHDFKKVSVNQITDIKETVDLAEVVAETSHLFRVSSRQSRMEVSIVNELPEQRGEWLGYPGSLSQVLLNLLGNAQRYAYAEETGGRVEITLAIEGSGDRAAYRITVRDFGHGMPPENVARIFDPFFTTGRGKGGSGLGMAIVYNIVTVHLAGAITVESTVGAGTTVALTLPRVVPG
jgi:signal transduction histidine kinase